MPNEKEFRRDSHRSDVAIAIPVVVTTVAAAMAITTTTATAAPSYGPTRRHLRWHFGWDAGQMSGVGAGATVYYWKAKERRESGEDKREFEELLRQAQSSNRK